MFDIRKNVVLLSGLFLLLTSLIGCDLFKPAAKSPKNEDSAQKQEVNSPAKENSPLAADAIARVGNWTLTTSEFEERLKILKQGLPDFNENDAQTRAAVVDELIRQQLLSQDAENSDIGKLKEIKDAVEDFRRTLLIQELANRVTKGVAATEEDAQKFYDENKKTIVEPFKWSVRQIVVGDEVTAKNLLVQILQGGNFSELAKSQSSDKASAQNGGAIEEFFQAPFEAMQNAIASLEAGSSSAVFKGPQGYYIVHVDQKKGGEPKSFEEVKKDLISGLTLRKQQSTILEYIDKLSKKTKVDVNKELLGGSK